MGGVIMLLLSLPKLTSKEFSKELNTLIKENEIILEEKDFPFLHSSINSILEDLIDYKKGETPLESYFLDSNLFIALNKIHDIYPFDIEEVRFLFISSLQEYFKNPEDIRIKGLYIDRLNMEVT